MVLLIGKVFKIKDINNGQYYICKKIQMAELDDKDKNMALQEAKILKEIKHTNIVNYIESFIENEELFIIMEYCEGKFIRRRFAKYY